VERLAEPVHDDHLQLRGGRRGGPRERNDVDAGREGLAEGTDGAAGRGEVREVAGALPVRHARQDKVTDVSQRGTERVGLRTRRCVRGELVAQEARVDAGVHGVVVHAGVVVGDEVDDLVALPAELVGVEQAGVLWRHISRSRREDGAVRWGAIVGVEV